MAHNSFRAALASRVKSQIRFNAPLLESVFWPQECATCQREFPCKNLFLAGTNTSMSRNEGNNSNGRFDEILLMILINLAKFVNLWKFGHNKQL